MFAAPQIKTDAELKGGTFGISSAGSESNSATTLALRRLGLDARRRHGQGDRHRPLDAAAQRRGRGDCAGRAATQPGHWRLGCASFVDLYAEKIPWLYSGLTVDRGYLADNRDTLTRFLKATIEGNYLAITDEKRAKEVLAKELKFTDAKIIDQSYANFKAETPPNAEIDRKGAENVLTTVAPPNASHNLDDYIDTSLTDELRKNGFIASMEKKYGKE